MLIIKHKRPVFLSHRLVLMIYSCDQTMNDFKCNESRAVEYYDELLNGFKRSKYSKN